jgi:hypothetical protein
LPFLVSRTTSCLGRVPHWQFHLTELRMIKNHVFSLDASILQPFEAARC